MGQARNCFNFRLSEYACWKTKANQNHLNFIDFDNAAAYCVLHRQRAFPQKMGVGCKQLALLQPDGADVNKYGSAASTERVTVHADAEQNGLRTATDIYCTPWKQCRTERNLNHA